jgi:hypothetical protein
MIAPSLHTMRNSRHPSIEASSASVNRLFAYNNLMLQGIYPIAAAP